MKEVYVVYADEMTDLVRGRVVVCLCSSCLVCRSSHLMVCLFVCLIAKHVKISRPSIREQGASSSHLIFSYKVLDLTIVNTSRFTIQKILLLQSYTKGEESDISNSSMNKSQDPK